MSEQSIQPDPPLTEEEQRLRQIEINKPLVALLDSWLEEDSGESPEVQRAELEAMMRGIDEHRTERKLFTEYLEAGDRRSEMSITRYHTVEDLITLGLDAPYELIDGELREVSPCFIDSSRIALRISSPLFLFVDDRDLGVVTGADGGYQLFIPGMRDTVVAPDVGFIRTERIPSDYDFRSFFPGAPDLAVEVNSISDIQMEVEDKIARNLAAGTRLIWEVRPLGRTVIVHRPGQPSTELGIEAVLDGEDVVPGFRLPIADIFREPRIGNAEEPRD